MGRAFLTFGLGFFFLGCGGAEGSSTSSLSDGSGRENPEEPERQAEVPEGPCSVDGLALIDAVNEFRAQNGLAEVPVSPSLCTVASTHVVDLVENRPYADSVECDLQSWSDATEARACCYAVDQSSPECMWEKPRELTDYPGFGYESVAVNNQGVDAAVAHFLSLDAYTDLFLERNSWSILKWRAIGAAYLDGHAVIWLGEEVDPVEL